MNYPWWQFGRRRLNDVEDAVEAVKIRAGRDFDQAVQSARWASEREKLFRDVYVLPIFIEFSRRLCDGCPDWSAAEIDDCCREFLRLLLIDAHFDGGRTAGISNPIEHRGSGGITSKFQYFLEQSDLWRTYEDIRLEHVAKRQSGHLEQMTPPVAPTDPGASDKLARLDVARETERSQPESPVPASPAVAIPSPPKAESEPPPKKPAASGQPTTPFSATDPWNVRLQTARKSKNWTQKRVAELLKCSIDSIKNHESGRNKPTHEHQESYAAHYGIDLKVLFSTPGKPRELP